jgi:hypothetical protein
MPEAGTLDRRRAVAILEALLAEVTFESIFCCLKAFKPIPRQHDVCTNLIQEETSWKIMTSNHAPT